MTAAKTRMWAVTAAPNATQADALQLRQVPRPAATLRADEVRLAVHATALNRADILQRQGHYAAPAGASPILGLECCGSIVALGSGVPPPWQVGMRVMALLTGGGYSEEVVTPYPTLLAAPPTWSDAQAAAFMEAALTAHLNLFMLGKLRRRQRALIHAGGSGVGTAALQQCREAQVACVVTVGSAAKAARCRALGAQLAINYTQEAFAAVLRADKRFQDGVEVILDCFGGSYFADNLGCLRADGRLVSIAMLRGRHAEIDLARLLSHRLHLLGSTLRHRTVRFKASIIKSLQRRLQRGWALDALQPVLHAVLPWHDAAAAHALMERREHFGKIVLQIL